MPSVHSALFYAPIFKALEMAGFCPRLLGNNQYFNLRINKALGVACNFSVREYLSPPQFGRAGRMLSHISSVEDFLELSDGGVMVGRHAASTYMRHSRSGRLYLDQPDVREALSAYLARSLASADAMRRILDRYKPEVAFVADKGYTPQGEFFDECLAREVPVLAAYAAHRNNAFMLKRYTSENRDCHPYSLCAESWKAMIDMPWSEDRWKEVSAEIKDCYSTGEWFAEVGTQTRVRKHSTERLQARFGLDPTKPTAIVFAHMFWDATFFWGEDLFLDYDTWFVETVKAACANTRLNWIIKLHPANLVKDSRDDYTGRSSELMAIEKAVGELPRHVKLIEAGSDISTLSLFGLMDYCLTVRGTIGIEASAFGISVLTAGTGRYDRRGFTREFDTKSDYLDTLDRLETLEPMTPEQIERARRFAYGTFIARPLIVHAIEVSYDNDAAASQQVELKTTTREDIRKSSDILAARQWIKSGSEDFLRLPD